MPNEWTTGSENDLYFRTLSPTWNIILETPGADHGGKSGPPLPYPPLFGGLPNFKEMEGNVMCMRTNPGSALETTDNPAGGDPDLQRSHFCASVPRNIDINRSE